MADCTMATPSTRERMERILGDIDQGRPGPTFLAQGGMHGNEPAGVHALRRVLRAIEERRLDVHGRILACRGNLQALEREERFLERDLNRQWLEPTVARLMRQDPAQDVAEDVEQRELLDLYGRAFEGRRGPLVFLDLHTSSAEGSPFTCMADTLPNRRIADAIPLPMILGLEECIDGAVMEWFNVRGQIGVAVEGGRHDAESAVDNLESAVWLALAASGVLARADVDVGRHRDRLRAAARGAPKVVEIRYRHAIRPADRFEMKRGYKSFDPVRRGEVLGEDAAGTVTAQERGLVLLPLYQGQGEDGFFVARAVGRFWYGLSAVVRRFHLGRSIALLPGVRRDVADPNTLLVDRRVARYLVVQVFHLFGYRRLRPREGKLAFSRRWAAAECRTLRPR